MKERQIHLSTLPLEKWTGPYYPDPDLMTRQEGDHRTRSPGENNNTPDRRRIRERARDIQSMRGQERETTTQDWSQPGGRGSRGNQSERSGGRDEERDGEIYEDERK